MNEAKTVAMVEKGGEMSSRKLLKLSPTLMGRLAGTAKRDNVPANEIMRRGLVAELDRMDAARSGHEAILQKAQRLANARGLPVSALLDQLLQQFDVPALPGLAELASTQPVPLPPEPIVLQPTGTMG